jgi:predicted GNAT family N-acyltransferase
MEPEVKILSYHISDRPDLARLANAVREVVFVIEQNVDPAIEYESEEDSYHYILFADEKAVATARWRETSKGIKLERFATLKSERKKGYGSALLKKVLEDVMPLKKDIYLHSQSHALHFYEEHGFVKKGEPFWEAEIEHYRMAYLGG